MSSRRYRQLAVACVIVSATFCVAPSSAEQAAPAAPGAKDPEKLMKSLEDLLKGYQDENATLRARVKELEAQVEKLKQSKAVVITQPAAPGQPQVPPSWKPFEFNGMTYYVVPLEDSRGGNVRTLMERQHLAPPADGPGRPAKESK